MCVCKDGSGAMPKPLRFDISIEMREVVRVDISVDPIHAPCALDQFDDERSWSPAEVDTETRFIGQVEFRNDLACEPRINRTQRALCRRLKPIGLMGCMNFLVRHL